VPRAGRAAAIIAIIANLVFTAYATLTMNGGHTWNLHRWNYPWHELTIGAVGNTLMFLVGCIASVVLPADSEGGPTLWDWLEMRRQSKREKALGETHEPVAQSS
jgi:hypothetical protein